MRKKDLCDLFILSKIAHDIVGKRFSNGYILSLIDEMRTPFQHSTSTTHHQQHSSKFFFTFRNSFEIEINLQEIYKSKSFSSGHHIYIHIAQNLTSTTG